MSRFLSVLSILAVVLLAMGFAAANAGHRVTIDLGLFTLYQVPVTLVAFSGLFVGMVAMFVTGVYTDLKVRRILRDRFSEESRLERTAIDQTQQDLFGGDPDSEDGADEEQLLEAGEGLEIEGSETESEADTETPLSEIEKPSDPQQDV